MKKITRTLLVFIISAFSISHAATFVKNYGLGYSSSVKLTSDSGYIVVGSTYDSSSVVSKEYISVIRTDYQGKVIWQKKKSFGISDCEGNAIIETRDKGFLVLGSIESESNDDDVLLLKINSSGNDVWFKTYGGSNFDILNDCNGIIATSDDCYVITGRTHSFSKTEDIFLLKVNENGEEQFFYTFGDSLNNVRSHGLIETENHGYLVSGKYWKSLSSDFKTYLLKTDAHGKIIWERKHSESTGYVPTLIAGNNHTYILLGNSSDNVSLKDKITLWEIDTLGNMGKKVEFDFPMYHRDVYAKSICKTPDNGYFIGADIHSPNEDDQMYVLKIGEDYSFQWDKTYGKKGQEILFDIQSHPAEGFLIVGTTLSQNTRWFNDIILLKTDIHGEVVEAPRSISISINGLNARLSWQNSPTVYDIVASQIYHMQDTLSLSPILLLEVPGGDSSFTLTNIVPGIHYSFWVKTISDIGGESELSDSVTLFIPDSTLLKKYQHHDNSFYMKARSGCQSNRRLVVEYSVLKNSNVSLELFDMRGKKIKVIVQKFMDSGVYTAEIDKSELGSGMYLLTYECSDKRCTNQIVINK